MMQFDATLRKKCPKIPTGEENSRFSSHKGNFGQLLLKNHLKNLESIMRHISFCRTGPVCMQEICQNTYFLLHHTPFSILSKIFAFVFVYLAIPITEIK